MTLRGENYSYPFLEFEQGLRSVGAPPGFGPTDIDFVLERYGQFLVIDFKRGAPRSIPKGQEILYQALVKLGFDVYVAFHTDERCLDITHVQRVGHDASPVPTTRGQLVETVNNWFETRVRPLTAVLSMPTIVGTSEVEMNWKKFVVRVTPTRAREWLEKKNPKNRKLDRRRVEAYARTMLRGEWEASPMSAIGFDSTGMLLNGHHRLEAVVQSGVPCEFVVLHDVPNSVLRFTDTEKPRTNAQIGRMFDEDTSYDDAFKIIERIRSGTDCLTTSDLAPLRAEFGPSLRSQIEGVRIAGRPLRAGIRAGFMMLLTEHAGSMATEFVADFVACASRSSLGHQASRNLVRWIENATGKNANLSLESVSAVLSAFNQYENNQTLARIHPNVSMLKKFRKSTDEAAE